MKTKLSVAASLAAVAFALSAFAEVPDAFLEYVESSGGITVSPLANNAKYPVSVNVAGGTCPSYGEGSKDGGAGSAVLVEGPMPGLMMIVR